MTRTHPPRLALWLLRYLNADTEPLVGDLIEEFRARPSHPWFWYQVLGALVIHPRRDPRDVCPLKLVDARRLEPVPPAALRARARTPAISLSGGPVPGIGGLSLIALGSLVTLVSPQIWWVGVGSLVTGALLGMALVLLHRPGGQAPASNQVRPVFQVRS